MLYLIKFSYEHSYYALNILFWKNYLENLIFQILSSVQAHSCCALCILQIWADFIVWSCAIFLLEICRVEVPLRGGGAAWGVLRSVRLVACLPLLEYLLHPEPSSALQRPKPDRQPVICWHLDKFGGIFSIGEGMVWCLVEVRRSYLDYIMELNWCCSCRVGLQYLSYWCHHVTRIDRTKGTVSWFVLNIVASQTADTSLICKYYI